MFKLHYLLLVSTLLSSSCGLTGKITGPIRPIELLAQTNDLSAVTTTVEKPIQLELAIGDGSKNISLDRIQWSLADPTAGSINSTGLFTPKRAGKVTIIAKLGPLTRELELTINANPVVVDSAKIPDGSLSDTTTQPEDSSPTTTSPSTTTENNTPKEPIPISETNTSIRLSLTPSKITLSKIGESSNFNVLATDSNGNAIENSTLKLVWESDRSDTISVDQNGLVTALKNGFATISVKTTDSNTATAIVQVGSSGTGTTPIDPNSGDVTAEIDFNG